VSFGLERRGQHAPRTVEDDLIERSAHLRAGVVIGHYSEHRRSFLAGAPTPAELVSVQRGRYVAPSNGSPIHKFRSYLLANPAAMSEGVSLHHQCHDAIYVDRTFNAGQYLQSVDRIHRLGLAPGTETRISFLVCRDTVDETVDDRIRTKAECLSVMLSDASLVTMALPDEEAYGEWVEPDDLDVLLRHLGDG
ncbi:MAG: hypothetical protein ACT4PW_13980, partial [Acidimicrobiia bacterium]